MAKRKDKGAGSQAVVAETVEERPGETVVHKTVREWHPHAPERLAEIEAIIDSWGRRSTDRALPQVQFTYDEVEARVDKLTRRVKDRQKVVVQETVTEWVERPVAEPEPEAEPLDEPVAEVEAPVGGAARPKRNFLSFLRKEKVEGAAKPRKARKAKDKKRPEASDPDYQPQCAALTEDGAQCRNSARGTSRYCSSHKGYQPPTAKGLAQRIEGDAWDPNDQVTDRESVGEADTRPVVRKAKDTRLKVRKAARKSAKKGRGKRR